MLELVLSAQRCIDKNFDASLLLLQPSIRHIALWPRLRNVQ